MNAGKVLFICWGLFFLVVSAVPVMAADFDWMRNMNITAQADPSGFRTRLATRFNLGGTPIDVVLGNVEQPADAYMVLRLGEMSSRPTEYVMERYQALKGKGWGVLAKNLGIKPGSQEFKALKQGSDLEGMGYESDHKKQKKDKGKSKKGK